MSMSLRVVVPPHPLIAHWLAVLRDQETPSPLFATAMAELGRWLTYEAVRDWLPQRPVAVQTPLALTEGMVVDPSVPVLAVPVLRAGLGLWQGGQAVLPSARVAHVGLVRDERTGEADCYLDALPQRIGERVGVMVFDPMLATAGSLIQVLERLQARGVSGQRLRVITALAASSGLGTLGKRFPDLTVYTACVDPELDEAFRIVPGLGDAGDRLYGSQSPVFPAEAQP
ncbi:uracil phosphoribosyltransferase [Synechococcus sp. BSF8S]|uniref:uracil phosphoribosyltransferase n=1 Tax=unclassified Synechococcus TaxID=2626047 RepID=UPI001627239D|nr:MULTISPECIES: uracil phosphoribosyltransferase [unclassified Synechococcus]MBC1260153.1 uracil phosphoribosyltransferase [Synechococcus sp. BSF8S]MBC1263030.1 uracil phosphoribosyltransferase [Synechococcus sp. BSA11S]